MSLFITIIVINNDDKTIIVIKCRYSKRLSLLKTIIVY